MSWAQVKFLYENQRAEVETCFFKVVVEGLVKPEDLEVGDTYSVFWSPNPEETPRDIMDQGNAVLDIDGLPELERRRRKKDGPLKGYYNAVLLSLKEDEDIERPYKRELSKSNCLPSHVKRTKVPSARAIEAKLNSGTSKNVKVSQTIPEPNGGSKRCVLPKSTVVESTKRNVENLFNKVAGSKSKSAKSSGRQHIHDSDPDYEPEIPEVRNAEYWRKKFEESQREVELTKRSLESVHKKKVTTCGLSTSHSQGEGQNRGGGSEKSVPTSRASTCHSQGKGQNRDGESERALKGIESPLHDDFDMDAFNEFSNIIDRHSTGMKEGRAGSSKSLEKAADNEDHTEEIVGDSMNSTEPVTLSDSPDSESSEDDFKVAPRRVKPPAKGPAGDSAALFQFCATLWKPEELVVRSPTGLPPPTKKGAAAYPRMTPQKVDQCRDFLKKRIMKENPETTDEEVDLRMSKVGYILGQKVSSTRRSFKNKNIPYPSAEEVLQEKKKKKEERRRLKKKPCST